MRDDIQLSPDQLKRYANAGTGCPARFVRSMAQEILLKREWDGPEEAFRITPDEQRIIEAIRKMVENG